MLLADLINLAQTLSFVHYCIKRGQNYALKAKEAITMAFKLDFLWSNKYEAISLWPSYRPWDGHQAFEEYRRFQPCYLSKLEVLTWGIISITNHNFDSEARRKIQNFWDQPCTKNWITIMWVLLQPWVFKSSINKRDVTPHYFF